MKIESELELMNLTLKGIAATLKTLAPKDCAKTAEDAAAKNILELIAHNKTCLDWFACDMDAQLCLPVSNVTNAIMLLCSYACLCIDGKVMDRIRDSALYDDPGVREAIDSHAEYAGNDEFCLVLLRNAMDSLMTVSLKRKIAKLQRDFMEMQGADRERVSAELSLLMEKYKKLKGEEQE